MQKCTTLLEKHTTYLWIHLIFCMRKTYLDSSIPSPLHNTGLLKLSLLKRCFSDYFAGQSPLRLHNLERGWHRIRIDPICKFSNETQIKTTKSFIVYWSSFTFIGYILPIQENVIIFCSSIIKNISCCYYSIHSYHKWNEEQLMLCKTSSRRLAKTILYMALSCTHLSYRITGKFDEGFNLV